MTGGARQITPRPSTVFVSLIAVHCLVAAGLLYFALVKRGHIQHACGIALVIWIQMIYKTVKRWRLLRYGEEIRRRTEEIVTPPTIDPH
jgi:hypothetical protein